jgi:CheY-like chemotaxis protein
MGMPSSRKTILVVDDEPQIRRVVKHALADESTRASTWPRQSGRT